MQGEVQDVAASEGLIDTVLFDECTSLLTCNK